MELNNGYLFNPNRLNSDLCDYSFDYQTITGVTVMTKQQAIDAVIKHYRKLGATRAELNKLSIYLQHDTGYLLQLLGAI